MTIAVIGDIHGKKIWKKIAEDAIKKTDKIIFLGDYVDPYPSIKIKNENFNKIKKWNLFINEKENIDDFTIDWGLNDNKFNNKKIKYIYPEFEETITVLEEIIDFKQKNMNKVILIIGNHDAHYLYNEIEACLRYDFKNSHKYKELYRKNKDLFQYCYQYGNKLFTHAGITNGWVNLYNNILLSFGLKNDFSNIGEVINKMGEKPQTNIILNIVSIERGGKSLYGGPTWADLTETSKDYLKGFDQYVGHTKVSYIHTRKNPKIPGSITYCDVLEKLSFNISNNYYIVKI